MIRLRPAASFAAALLAGAALAGCASAPRPPASGTAPVDPAAPLVTGPSVAPGAPAAALPDRARRAGAPPGVPVDAPVDDELFRALGGHTGIESLTERFIREIAADETLRPRFRDVNIARFHRTLQEQLCAESGGGCTYTGDDMRRAHAGLDITRAEFAATVEALMRAMDAEGLPVAVQNRVLALHAPKRADVLGE